MSKTQHIQARMSHRGITEDMVDLALEYGIESGDKVILNRKGLGRLIDTCRATQKTAEKMMKKGGIIVVESGGDLVTTYNLNSYKRRHSA